MPPRVRPIVSPNGSKLLLPQSSELWRPSANGAGEIDAIIAHTAKKNLRAFFKFHWRLIDPAPFIDSWAVDAMADHLQAVSHGQIRNLIINVPPRFSKSTLTSVAWPAWTWAQDVYGLSDDDAKAGLAPMPLMGPQVAFYCLTYSHNLSMRDATKMRNLVMADEYQSRYGHSLNINDDENEKRRFVNNHKGYRFSTSFDGQLTGDGGDVILIDDPHNATEAESDASRQGVIDAWRETIQTRHNNARHGAFVIIMQRLHSQDLSGHILEQNDGDWVHLCLPMEFEPDRKCYTVPVGFSEEPWEDPRTQPGELLHPARFSKEAIDRLKRNMGSHAAAGQLQQRPSPRAGGIIKVSDWQVWDKPKFPAFELVIGSLDTSLGDSKKPNAYSALTLWGMWATPDGVPQAMLVYAWHERAELFQLVTRTRESLVKYGASRLLIENKANGLSVSQEMRRLFKDDPYSISMINPKGDKVARAHAVTPIFEDGGVWAPNRTWADEVITECALFPKGQFADYVDSTTQALSWLRRNNLIQRESEHRRERAAQNEHVETMEPLYDT
jgi:predicted phage terminase large subunit-like protein